MRHFASAALVLALAACSSAPVGPKIIVMPGQDKTFDQFQMDDAVCRDFATQQSGGSPQGAAVSAEAKTAAVGAVAGAAIGAAVGNRNTAAAGAGVGALAGIGAGVAAASGSAKETQRAYDIAYAQCMAAKGNKVPMAKKHRVPAFGAQQ